MIGFGLGALMTCASVGSAWKPLAPASVAKPSNTAGRPDRRRHAERHRRTGGFGAMENEFWQPVDVVARTIRVTPADDAAIRTVCG
jgi:hypothetical protein